MLKNILNLDGAQQLTKNEQKSINGGIILPCVDSGKVCTDIGNAACPRGQGCFIQDSDPDNFVAICQCLKK